MIACPHRCGDYCADGSRQSGRPFQVTDHFCGNICARSGGPYAGHDHRSECLKAKWAFSVLNSAGHEWTASIAEKVRRYRERQPVALRIPAFVEDVRRDFAEIAAMPNVADVGITGSALANDTESGRPKDVDIIVVVRDLRAHLNNTTTIYDAIPSACSANGAPYDVFVSDSTLWFAYFGLVSGAFHTIPDVLEVTTPSGSDVVEHEGDVYLRAFLSHCWQHRPDRIGMAAHRRTAGAVADTSTILSRKAECQRCSEVINTADGRPWKCGVDGQLVAMKTTALTQSCPKGLHA